MVQKNVLCPSCRQEDIFDKGISWKDLQGLSWLFCEDCINTQKLATKPMVACA